MIGQFIQRNNTTYSENLMEFIEKSPCAVLATSTIATMLSNAGFTELKRENVWNMGAGAYFCRFHGALIAWIIPEEIANTQAIAQFRIIGTHLDSPTFKIKPTPDHHTADGWNKINVEKYGGLLPNSWLDRDLGIAGIIITHDGKHHYVKTPAIARIAQLAVHLMREQSSTVELNPQLHLQPLWSISDESASILEVIARYAYDEPLSSTTHNTDSNANPECAHHSSTIHSEDIASYELFCYDTQGPARLGTKQEFMASGRQDNLLSTFSGVTALLRWFEDYQSSHPTNPNTVEENTQQIVTIPVYAGFDHEEVGSESATGASGPLLETILHRIVNAVTTMQDVNGTAADELYYATIARSMCVSADVAHSVHPNYPEKHDPDTRPMMSHGPVIKMNANQRYSTDAMGWNFWEKAAKLAGEHYQTFVSNNAIPCGSTIAPLTATRLGMTTVDVGVPILSMHSARELCSFDDQIAMTNIMLAALNV